MDKKKNSTCGCFSFLRRKSSKTQKPIKSNSVPFIQEKVENDQVQTSILGSFPRQSSIVPPLVSRQSFFPSGHNDNVANFSYTGETSDTKPMNPPIDHVASLARTSEKMINNESHENTEITANLVHMSKHENIGKLDENIGKLDENIGKFNHNIGNYGKNIGKFGENIGKFGNNYILNEGEISRKDRSDGELGKNDQAKNPHLIIAPVLSPEWLSGTSKFASPGLASIGLSPVRMEDGEDECSDFEGFVKTTGFGMRRQVPDIFIRSNMKQRFLPIIKPTTPAFFTKRRPIQIFRQEKVL